MTRPLEQSLTLCYALEQAKAVPVKFPTIAFAPPADPEFLMKAEKKLPHLQVLIFLSPQTVKASETLLRKFRVHLTKKQVILIAIGPGTKARLQSCGLNKVICPAAYNSEGLLQLPLFTAPQGLHIGIVRGEGGLGMLAPALLERGAQVTEFIFYQRILPAIDRKRWQQTFMHLPIDAIICTSGDSLTHLQQLVAVEIWQRFQHVYLVVISKRLQDFAHRWGFKHIRLADNASDAAIMHTLCHLYKEKPNGP